MGELLIRSVDVCTQSMIIFACALHTEKLASIACVTSGIENRFRDLF